MGMDPQPGCLAILLALILAIGGLAVMSEDTSVGPTPAPMLVRTPAPALEPTPAP